MVKYAYFTPLDLKTLVSSPTLWNAFPPTDGG